MPDAHLSNLNSLWGAYVLEGLRALGVRMVVTSPGSRSTPLTFAATQVAGLKAVSILDERSAAFFALGAARSSHRPVALICTSGSAAGHWLPAVMEAFESGVPLILLTADRPPELRHSRAGQTTDQLSLFGRFVRYAVDIPLPELSAGIFNQAGSLLQDAVHAATEGFRGPVHLNFPFRDPLAPEDAEMTLPFANPLEHWKAGDFQPSVNSAGQHRSLKGLPEKGLILAGWAQPENPQAWSEKALVLARALGWPIWADVGSPLRHYGAAADCRVSGYDVVARNAEAFKDLPPEGVIVLGEPPTSKVARGWLEKCQPRCWTLGRRQPLGNALSLPAVHWIGDLQAMEFEDSPQRGMQNSWCRQWLGVDKAYADHLQQTLEKETALHGPSVAYHVGKAVPEGSRVWIAASMPVRDAEWFWPASDRQYRVMLNRGLNGIDGLISSALGMVAACAEPGVLIMGDLAFLHDAGGLANGRLAAAGLTVIVINNGGGGIFDHLPIAGWDPPFEEFFATPQTASTEGLAVAYGWEYQKLSDVESLREALGLTGGGLRVLEVGCNRLEERLWRRQFFNNLKL
jgi:2-succinyl-5-enolpyruvyl-6-hydroxy-3-cyclohexene-1-carboxylate synthase